MKVGIYKGNSIDSFTNKFDIDKFDILFESDLGFADVFEFKGKTYYVRGKIYPLNIIYVEEITIKPEDEVEDLYFESEVVCPYCGNEFSDSFELGDSEDEETCSCCGGVFSYEREVRVTYNSSPVKAPQIKRITDES